LTARQVPERQMSGYAILERLAKPPVLQAQGVVD